MDGGAWLSALVRDGAALGDAVRRAGLDAAVPSCPKWTVRDLVAHTGSVYRWVGEHVVRGMAEPPDPLRIKNPGADPLAWLNDGLTTLIHTLSDVDPALPAWNFSPPAAKVAAFWQRRMAHETAIHRWDAELAADAPGTFEPAFAADGVGEVLNCLPGGYTRSRSCRHTAGFGWSAPTPGTRGWSPSPTAPCGPTSWHRSWHRTNHPPARPSARRRPDRMPGRAPEAVLDRVEHQPTNPTR